MHIDHLVTSLGAGGAESLVANLAKEQVASGHTVRIWTLMRGAPDTQDFQTSRAAELASHGIAVRRIGAGPRRFVGASWKLRGNLRSSGPPPDLLHAHSPVTAAVGIIGGRGIPKVLTIHSTQCNLPTPLWRGIDRGVSTFVAVSEGSKEAFGRHLTKPVHVIENGIPLRHHLPLERDFDKKSLQLLAVGNLRREKNHSRLLEALVQMDRLLGESDIRVRLLIAGDGDQRSSLTNQIQSLGLKERVALLGIRRDVPALMSQSDVFVISSDFEGVPVALLEAMASGLPSVVTPFNSAPDLLASGRVGVVASDFTPQALGQAIALVVGDPKLRRRFSREALSRSHDFSIGKCAEKYDDVYTRL